MNSNQLKLNEIWNKNAIPSDHVCFTIDNEIRVQSSITSSSSTTTSPSSTTTSPSSTATSSLSTITSLLPTVSYSLSTISSSSMTELSSSITTNISSFAGNSSLSVTVSSSSTIPSSSLTTFSSSSTTASPLFVSISSSSLLPIEVNAVGEDLRNNRSTISSDDNCNLSYKSKTLKKKNSKSRTKHRDRYLSHWEKDPTAQYKTYIFDNFGAKHEKLVCWLYFKDGSMRCCLCEKFGNKLNFNGRENAWNTTGMKTLSLDKVKKHKEEVWHTRKPKNSN